MSAEKERDIEEGEGRAISDVADEKAGGTVDGDIVAVK